MLLAGCSRRPGISYAAFLNELEAGNVSEVELSSDRAAVTLQGPVTDQSLRQEVGEVLVVHVEIPPTESVRNSLLEIFEDYDVPFSVTEPR
jgi:hypothetical protein